MSANTPPDRPAKPAQTGAGGKPPESRQAKLARARKLARDPNYPDPKTLERVAEILLKKFQNK